MPGPLLIGKCRRIGFRRVGSNDWGSFSQDMTVLDAELPYALIDFMMGVVLTIMSAILMCFSAGYFAAIIPPLFLVVWGTSTTQEIQWNPNGLQVLQR